MVRPTDQKKTGIENKILCSSQFPRKRDTSCHVGSHGEALRSVKRQKEWEKRIVSKSLYCGFVGME